MPNTREVIAVAGVGDLGKYICEELVASDQFDVIVLSRGVSRPKPRISLHYFLGKSPLTFP